MSEMSEINMIGGGYESVFCFLCLSLQVPAVGLHREWLAGYQEVSGLQEGQADEAQGEEERIPSVPLLQ